MGDGATFAGVDGRSGWLVLMVGEDGLLGWSVGLVGRAG